MFAPYWSHDRFSRFCTAHPCARHTQTDHASDATSDPCRRTSSRSVRCMAAGFDQPTRRSCCAGAGQTDGPTDTRPMLYALRKCTCTFRTCTFTLVATDAVSVTIDACCGTTFGWGTSGNVTSVGWQVTLCDPTWDARSRSGVAG